MKKFYCCQLPLVIVLFFLCIGLNAQNYHLVKDINTYTDANPANNNLNALSANNYAVLNGVAYFMADDGVHGSQLWRSDGTAEGTTLVKSIVPAELTATNVVIDTFKNKLIIAVSNQDELQLWSSDGTATGTIIIKGSLPDVENFYLTGFLAIGNLDYFIAGTGYLGEQLWATDGTTAGTKMVANLYTAAFDYGYNVNNLINYNDTLYFSMINNAGSGLWRSDGTATGTHVVKTHSSTGGLAPSYLTPLNGKIYYTADGFIWASDGTTAGTVSVASNNSVNIIAFQGNIQFPVIKHNLFFVASTANAYNLYKYNTDSSNGFELVSTIINGLSVTDLPMPVINDSLLFYVAYDANQYAQLWSTNGYSANNVLLKSSTISKFSPFSNFAPASGELYFSAYDETLGFELWKSDGTLQGTVNVKDISPGIYSSYPACIASNGSAVLFSANDGITGNELWKTNGTAASTALVKDINKTTTASGIGSFYYPFFYKTINNNQLLFYGNDYLHGSEVWKTDGTTAGTYLLKDASPGSLSSFFTNSNLQKMKDDYYYAVSPISDTLTIWKTDGTVTNNVPVQNFIGYNSYFNNISAGKNLVYIMIQKDYLAELWVTDGSPGSARLLAQNINYFASGLGKMVTVGDTLYFTSQGTNGSELWVSDGTTAGTKTVQGITLGGGYFPYNLTAFNGKLFFTANDGTGAHLWVTNGTTTGTSVVKAADVEYLSYTLVNGFTVSGNKFYFTADDGTTGQELWASDGTATGTQLVKDIYPGTNTSYVSNLVDVNGTLYFAADDGVHGYELWKTDGSALNTVQVKDITPGSDGSSLQFFTSAGGYLYFTTGISSLWRSDGTADGTVAVTDEGLKGVSVISDLVGAGDKLYFTGYTYAYGYELYVGQADAALPVTLLSFTGQWAKKDAQLNWVTTNEINNSHFNVQRSLTGTGFATIGSVAADGNGTTKHNYTYTDVNAASLGGNSVYYRLQQVDLDGKFTYSNIIRLNTATNITISIAPNPAQKTAYITSSLDITGAAIIITDITGRVVYKSIQTLSAGAQVPVNIANLAAGIYSVTVQGNGGVKQESKLVVK